MDGRPVLDHLLVIGSAHQCISAHLVVASEANCLGEEIQALRAAPVLLVFAGAVLVVYLAYAGGYSTGNPGYCLGGRDTEPLSRLIDESVVEKTRPFECHIVLYNLMLLVPRNPRIDHQRKSCIEKAGAEGHNCTGRCNVAVSGELDNVVRDWKAEDRGKVGTSKAREDIFGIEFPTIEGTRDINTALYLQSVKSVHSHAQSCLAYVFCEQCGVDSLGLLDVCWILERIPESDLELPELFVRKRRPRLTFVIIGVYSLLSQVIAQE